MINRPPTPEDAVLWSDYPYTWSDVDYCMQEALTCEWLIQMGLMPDPSELYYTNKSGVVYIGWRKENRLSDWPEWDIEDKTR